MVSSTVAPSSLLVNTPPEVVVVVGAKESPVVIMEMNTDPVVSEVDSAVGSEVVTEVE